MVYYLRTTGALGRESGRATLAVCRNKKVVIGAWLVIVIGLICDREETRE